MQLIGIVGQINSGKDTVAQFLVDRYHFVPMAMADSLKILCHEFFRVPKQNLWGPSEQRTTKVRTLLQTLGTDVARRYNPNIWVIKFLERMEHIQKHGEDPYGLIDKFPLGHLRVVVPDVRFPNEANCIRDESGKILRITRAGNYHDVGTAPDQRQHESEIAQTDITGDALIKNNGTLRELEMLVYDTYEMLFNGGKNVSP